jgi:hypothetical protein
MDPALPAFDLEITQAQRYVLALTKICSASLSLMASSVIVYKVYLRYHELKKRSTSCVQSGSLRSNRKHDITTYHRMLVGISILDIMYSFWSALGVISVPPSSGDVFAHGTIATCSTQAFFIQLMPSIVLYMAALNTYFMLKIRYNVSDAVIAQHYEFWFHAIPIVVWLVIGTAGLSLKIFGPLGYPEMGCWVGDYPYGCAFTDTCTRGYKVYEYLNWYAWATCFIWLFFSVFVVVVNSILIFTAIRKQEQRNAKYLSALLQGTAPSTSNLTLPSLSNMSHSQGSLKINENDIVINTSPTRNDERPESTAPENSIVADAESGNGTPIATEDALFRNPSHRDGGPSPNQDVVVARKMKQSRTAAVQSSLYCGSAFFTTFWWFLIWLIGNFWVLGISSVTTHTFVFLAMMVNIVLPSQGIFNLFIFVRLQYLQLRSNHQDWSRWRCMKQCMFSVA